MLEMRHALRLLAKSPGFTALAILTLALGIGVNSAIFSVVDGVLLRPAPVASLDRLVMVWETDRNSGTTREPASVPDYLDFRERATRFDRLAAFAGTEVNLVPETGDPVLLPALAVTSELLPMLDMRPRLGRLFTADDDLPGTADVVLVGEAAWRTVFAADPEIVGRTIRLDDMPFTVAGILPAQADFGALQILRAADYSRGFADRATATEVAAWIPLRPDPQRYPRSTHPIFVVGRLAQGAGLPAAQDEMTAITADLERIYPENNGRGAVVQPLDDVIFGPARPALWVLLAAAGLVLLAACANVSNLLLARGSARAREIAVRTALGAGTARLTRQFLVEGLVLAGTGALLGLLFAFWGLDVLLAMAPADIPRVATVSLDARVLGAALGTAALVGLAFGIASTLQARRIDLQSGLKTEPGREVSASIERRRMRSALVVAELALAVILVTGAGLLIRSFWLLHQVDPGFRAEGVLKAEFQLPASRYPRGLDTWPAWPEVHAFNDALLGPLAALPSVSAAAIAGNHPLDAGFTNSFAVIGREAEAATWPEISVRRVTPGYFQTVRLPLLGGRALRDADDETATPVLLMNSSAAERFFPGADPIGHRISLWGRERTIVGIVADERFHGLHAPAPLAIYLPLRQAPSVNGAYSLLLRSVQDPLLLVPAVRAAFGELDPALAVFGVEPLARTVARSVGQQRFTMLLVGLFAALALAIGTIGVYGVLAYLVAQRTREIGVRMALGAEPGDVLRLVVREGAALAALGILAGSAGALAASRVLSGLLFGVGATDPATYLAVASIMASAALLASWLPARRAARLDPVRALRAE